MAQLNAVHNSLPTLEALERSLSPPVLTVLGAFRSHASRLALPLYLVGGSVRDLLLGRPIEDLDLVVEGEAVRLAQEVCQHTSGRLVSHSRFGTATVQLDGKRYDVATARMESYARPGALPRILPSNLEDDLRRRDFTINAMALCLAGPHLGRLVDSHAGLADLERGLVRVLHPNSFVDDPTRLLRAVRYEQRLRFRLEDKTLALFSKAIARGSLYTAGPDRIRRELGLMLAEAHPHAPLLRAAELLLLSAIFPDLGQSSVLERLNSANESEGLVYLAALAHGLSQDEGEAFVHRLNMPVTWARVVRDSIALRLQDARLVSPSCSPSMMVQAVEKLAPASIRAAQLLSQHREVRDRLGHYLASWRRVRPSLNGRDLAGLGVPQGPLVGELLWELRRARLDGELTSRREEVAFIQRRLAAEGGESTHG